MITAIPFPPLNFNQIGNKCPKNIKKINKSGINWVFFNNIKGMYPFNISQIKVIKPSRHPLVLVILVAPIFFEPSSLGSFFLKIKDINRPKGIDPMI